MRWLPLLMMLAGPGCARPPAVAPPPAEPRGHLLGNARCPVSGAPVAGRPEAPAFAATWRGETIGLMCPACLREFQAAPPAQKDRWLELARASAPR